VFASGVKMCCDSKYAVTNPGIIFIVGINLFGTIIFFVAGVHRIGAIM
jgi:hypothetical protein